MSSHIETLFSRLIYRIEHLERVVQRQNMRINNMIREGSIDDVDYEKGLAVIEAQGIKSKPMPWLQQAGDMVDWDPPVKGQRMVQFSPHGDLGRGFLIPGGYTDQFKQPSTAGKSFMRKLGATKITGGDGSYEVETGTFRIKGNLIVEGGVFTHNGVNVGSTHKHLGVLAGTDISDVPTS